MHHEIFLSQDAEDMQDGIEQSTLDNVRMEDPQEDEICKEINNIMGDMFKDTRVSVNDILEWRREVMASTESMWSKININLVRGKVVMRN